MARWADFERTSPALAKLGYQLLIKKGRGYLGTIRGDGGPRVQAICPVLWDGCLYAGLIRATPKHNDLVRDGRYTLHAPLAEGDAEFWIRGEARLLTDAETESIMAANPAWKMPIKNSMFSLDIGSAHGTIFKPAPDNTPIPDRRTFRASDRRK
jgi:hypothetical protein